MDQSHKRCAYLGHAGMESSWMGAKKPENLWSQGRPGIFNAPVLRGQQKRQFGQMLAISGDDAEWEAIENSGDWGNWSSLTPLKAAAVCIQLTVTMMEV